jgi:uncharacterized membrane protein
MHWDDNAVRGHGKSLRIRRSTELLPDNRPRARLRALNRQTRPAALPESLPQAIAPDLDGERPRDARATPRRSVRGLAAAIWASPDVLLLLGAAVTLSFILFVPTAVVRVPIGILLVLIAPGYALTAAIFNAKDDELRGVTRLALSFGLSLAVIPVIALVIHFSPVQINPASVTTSLAIWILFWVGLATWRRSSDSDQRTRYSQHEHARYESPSSRNSRIGVFAFSVLLVVGTALALVLSPGLSPTQGVTEFYMLGESGEARDFPQVVPVGEPVSVTIGIVNGSDSDQRFMVEVWASDIHEATASKRLDRIGPIEVTGNATIERDLEWRMPAVGAGRVAEIVLTKENDGRPYRTLRLVFDVDDVELSFRNPAAGMAA